MTAWNEYGPLRTVALRGPAEAFVDADRIAGQWRGLRFHGAPRLDEAVREHANFTAILARSGAEVHMLPGGADLTLDAIYVRDALIAAPGGLIICHMGRETRRPEARANAAALEQLGFAVLGAIAPPGTLEGGDLIWIDANAAAVGLGPRTNEEGIRQLHTLLGAAVDLETVPLTTPRHPDDVFHLMSIISPLDRDLALIRKPLIAPGFLDWLAGHGIEFVAVASDEFPAMACNVLALGPRHVVMLDGLPCTRARLEAAGCRVEVYKGDEINRKGDGGPTCLARPLIRKAL